MSAFAAALRGLDRAGAGGKIAHRGAPVRSESAGADDAAVASASEALARSGATDEGSPLVDASSASASASASLDAASLDRLGRSPKRLHQLLEVGRVDLALDVPNEEALRCFGVAKLAHHIAQRIRRVRTGPRSAGEQTGRRGIVEVPQAPAPS